MDRQRPPWSNPCRSLTSQLPFQLLIFVLIDNFLLLCFLAFAYDLRFESIFFNYCITENSIRNFIHKKTSSEKITILILIDSVSASEEDFHEWTAREAATGEEEIETWIGVFFSPSFRDLVLSRTAFVRFLTHRSPIIDALIWIGKRSVSSLIIYIFGRCRNVWNVWDHEMCEKTSKMNFMPIMMLQVFELFESWIKMFPLQYNSTYMKGHQITIIINQ